MMDVLGFFCEFTGFSEGPCPNVATLRNQLKEQDEVIAYARAEIQAIVGCQGWETQWCPTSCRWWKVCQPMEEREVE